MKYRVLKSPRTLASTCILKNSHRISTCKQLFLLLFFPCSFIFSYLLSRDFWCESILFRWTHGGFQFYSFLMFRCFNFFLNATISCYLKVIVLLILLIYFFLRFFAVTTEGVVGLAKKIKEKGKGSSVEDVGGFICEDQVSILDVSTVNRRLRLLLVIRFSSFLCILFSAR